jgi:hypothetical protein
VRSIGHAMNYPSHEAPPIRVEQARHSPHGASPNGQPKAWGPAESDVTRHLCATAHLDHGKLRRSGHKFRRAVLEDVGRHPYRALGASPGVEMTPVIVHCRAANARKLVRDAVLTGVLLVFLVALAVADTTAERVVVGVCAAVISWEVVYAEMAFAINRVVAPLLLRGSQAPSPEVPSGHDDQLDAVMAAERGNITVYSGFSPFVGAGTELGGWSFAVDTNQAKSELGRTYTPQPFTLEQLYAYVAEAVTQLSRAGVTIDDQVYVDGRELREDPRFLRQPLDRPRIDADPELLASVMTGADEHIRFYKRIRVYAWRGELVLTVFLRFTQISDKLFTEVNYLLLPPLERRYRHADEIARSLSWRRRLKIAAEALVATPFLWPAAPFALMQAAIAPYKHWREQRRWRREVRENPAFDYGARPTLRERTSSPNFDHYFQKLDSEMFQKIIERQMLNGLIEFLDDHGIDTSDLKERETAILNNGVIVTGGSIRAESLAVGKGAQATTRRKAKASTA